ncbi:GPP34 family phosphoprotein [Streptomyces sp. NPDC127106]|uniref:GPP34 family phosphoprotein n=1 Tax=Streptomyces sp. NPDC127106 TaxID=3345360 RepID=UPI00363F0BD5
MTATPQLYALCAAADGCFPPPRREAEAGRALAGALLFEGALAGRLELHGDRVLPKSGARTGDPALDVLFARVAASPRPRAPADWVERLGPWALALPRPGPLPGAPPDGPAGPQTRAARQRVADAVREPRRAVLPAVAAGALLAASGLHDACLPGLSRAQAARLTSAAVAALGPVGVPVAAAARAVSRSLRASAASLAFPG